MKKLLIILSFFLTISLSGQIYPGVVSSQGVIVSEEEECTQNLLLYSEELNRNEVPWETVNVTVTANQANDIDGNATLEEVSFGWSNAVLKQILTVSASTTYRFSFEAHRGTGTECNYGIYDLDHYADIVSTTSYYASINGSTPTRISFEFTTPAGCTSIEAFVIWGSSESGTMYVGRVQLETNGSCYITTTNEIITP